MKIWLTKNSEIPAREQLATQITLAIVSGDLPAGEKLPSTRELARRFQIHANTVGSAYGKLSEKGLIEFKKGSGFYVRAQENTDRQTPFELDALVAEFFRRAQSRGFSRTQIQTHLQKLFAAPPPENILVIESDKQLRAILIEEIRQTSNLKVSGASIERLNGKYSNALIAAMIDEKSKIETVLPAKTSRVFLVWRSVSASMDGETRPAKSDLIAVVSGWEKFLGWAKTILTAAEVETDSIILRSTGEANWRNGLKNASLIICDALTAKEFSGDKRVRPFYLISDDSLNALREFAGN